MTAAGALLERSRPKGNVEQCKRCRHSYDDVLEGWNCRKFDATIVLSSGAELDWPGQACDRAFANDCQGFGFEPAAFGWFKAAPFWPRTLILALVLPVAIVAVLRWVYLN